MERLNGRARHQGSIFNRAACSLLVVGFLLAAVTREAVSQEVASRPSFAPHSLAPQALAPQTQSSRAAGDPQAEMRRWVQALGSRSFAERQEAHRILLGMRNEAYDLLLEASHDSDVEIRLASRSLLEHLQIQWIRPTDSDEVAKILKGYGERTSDERWVWIQRLARVQTVSGRAALARLVRYEPSETLSQRAAVLLLERLPLGLEPVDPRREKIDTATLAQTLQSEITGSQRRGTEWLQAYLHWLDDPATGAEEATRLVRLEIDRVAPPQAHSTLDRHIVLSLARWEARIRHASGDRELDELHNLLANLVGSDERAAKEHLDWLASWDQWSAIVTWSQVQADATTMWPEVLFRVADAQDRLDQPTAAQATRNRAIQVLPVVFEDREALAHSLYAFGYFGSATFLLEQLQEQASVNSDEAWRSGLDLVDWYIKADRIADASRLLDRLVDQADESPNGWMSIRSPDDRSWIRGEREWLRARCLADTPEQCLALDTSSQTRYLEHLDQALTIRSSDVELLVHRYWLSQVWNSNDSERWHTRLQAQQTEAQRTIDAVTRDLARFPVASVEQQLESELARQQIILAQLLLALDQDRPRAIELARAAVDRFPESGDYWHIYASALARESQWDLAAQAQQQALLRAPEFVAWRAELLEWNRLATRPSETLNR